MKRERLLLKKSKKKESKFARQAIVVSPKQLREIADELDSEMDDLCVAFDLVYGPGSIKFQVNIINKTPECSDTWEFEEGGKIDGKNNRKRRKGRNTRAS